MPAFYILTFPPQNISVTQTTAENTAKMLYQCVNLLRMDEIDAGRFSPGKTGR
jgi:hypothetical protein